MLPASGGSSQLLSGLFLNTSAPAGARPWLHAKENLGINKPRSPRACGVSQAAGKTDAPQAPVLIVQGSLFSEASEIWGCGGKEEEAGIWVGVTAPSWAEASEGQGWAGLHFP